MKYALHGGDSKGADIRPAALQPKFCMKETIMNKFCPELSHRFLCLETLGLLILFFVVEGADQARAQLVDKFLVTSFSTHKEPAVLMPGSRTAAVTVITFSNIHNTPCNVSVKWNRQDGTIFCETITNQTTTVLPANGSINHCSRSIMTSSGIPNCSTACVTAIDQPIADQVEGSARVQIDVNCASKIGVEATTYYTLFNDDLQTETIISARSVKIYRIENADILPSE